MDELVLRLDPAVEKKLEKNGWYKARNGDLTQTINQWNDDGYKIFNSAKFFLKSFNNLRVEPYRVCRRVNILRDYPDDKIKIYP